MENMTNTTIDSNEPLADFIMPGGTTVPHRVVVGDGPLEHVDILNTSGKTLRVVVQVVDSKG